MLCVRSRTINLLPKQFGHWGHRQLTHFSSRPSPLNPTGGEGEVVFSGIQPTGIPHLGNYLGALREWVRLQDTKKPDGKLFFSIVDLHALTVAQHPEQLRRWRRESFATLLAVGLDPEKSTMFYQSSIPEHSELMWILSTAASMGRLSRMTQWKSKSGLANPYDMNDSKARLGLFSYPVLQAADVLVHKASHVPVGEDQQQHIEFARNLAGSFNHLHGEVLTLPTALIPPAKRVMSLREPRSKMSKSDPDPRSRILITDTKEDIHAKIRAAVTDSLEGVEYRPVERPGVSNLVEIAYHIDPAHRSVQMIAKDMRQHTMRVFKEHVADLVSEHLKPIREAYRQLMDAPKRLEEAIEKGTQEASDNAASTMKGVKEVLGLR